MLRPGDSFDRYVIEGVLGEGGMGRVYRALDPRLGRRVALKVLVTDDASAQVSADAAARMMREARAAAAFSHPNVVAIHDVGSVDGSPYITMELVTGSTLRERSADPSVSAEQKLEWLVAVARGLAAAHKAGLVHRDIKPENVMVTADGGVKILDFGIARRSEDASAVDVNAATASPLPSLTAEGVMVGTPQYMAPEQLQAAPLDGRADQFAWAVMAWELFAGKLPWGAARSGAQVIAAVLAAPVPPLSDVTPAAPSQLAACVARALSKDRSGRFANMDELLLSLDGRASGHIPAAAASPVTTVEAGGAPAVVAAPRRPGWPWVLVAGALAAAALVPALARRGGGRPAEEAKESDRLSKNAVDGPVVGLCAEEVKADCGKETTAWCDPNGRVVGCCGKGLVATGTDGICDCPPGGDLPDAAASTCAVAPGTGIPRAGEVITSLRPKFRACYNASLASKPDLSGHMIAKLLLGPDGRVFSARFVEGKIADRTVMSCVLGALRDARFDPPPGGAASLQVPIGFVQAGESGKDAAPPSSPEPAGMPGRHPCRAKGSCSSAAVAWCDADEKELACCDPGLVAVGHDGMCECPPGGMTKPTGSCQPAKLTKAEWKKVIDALPDGIGPSLDKCLHTTDAALAWGATEIERVFDPDGRVGSLRIVHSSLPGVHAQQCVLDGLRSFRGPPPPDGTFVDTVGIDLGKPTQKDR